MNQTTTKKDPLNKQAEDTLCQEPLSEGANNVPTGEGDVPISGSTTLINLDEIRLSQDFASAVGTKKILTTVPIRKPNKQVFFRVHPSEDFRLPLMVLELKEEGETYLVKPHLRQELAEEITPKMLVTCVTRQGDCFLWPIRLHGEDGRLDPWNQSALEAAEIGKEKWIRLLSNRSLGAYEVVQATDNLPEPKWPEVSFQELVTLAFKGKVIQDLEHPILRQLRGAN